MKKNGKLLFGIFLVVFVVATALGTVFVVNNINSVTATFNKDGYALYIGNESNAKAQTYSFKAGTDYKLKKSGSKISFESDDGSVSVDDSTIIHYSDKSIGVMKKVVGIDASTINSEIVFYYNIFKDTKIEYSKGEYKIKVANGDSISFKNLLMRVDVGKFLLTGENVRLVFPNEEEIIDFGNYVEFEYTSGNVVKVYNNEKFYQTIANDAVLLVGDIKIGLKDAEVYKENKKYISLTNLVMDNDGNIDTLKEEKENLDVSDGELDTSGNAGGNATGGISGGATSSGNATGGVAGDGSEDDEEVIVDGNEVKKVPVYRITELLLTSLKIDAKIEIIDDDNLISSDTVVKIIENATSKTVAETTATMGDSSILISHADLKPDTEYTITARASYKIGDVEYSKTFISKIFRTDEIGVSFEKSYATQNSIVLEILKEEYSKVSSLVMEIYDKNGTKINYQEVTFDEGISKQEVIFNELNADTSYLIKMSDVLVQGVIVDDGFSQKENVKTLKEKVEIGNLTYEIDKKNARFNLIVESVKDPSYGVKSYRYEVYDARNDISTSEPVLVLSQDTLASVPVNVDGVKISRGVSYTYVLVVEFFDNEKTIEISKELGSTMTLDGVEFPTVRFDESSAYITWEQINGTIIVDDPSNAIVSNSYKIVYKNSVDVHKVETIIADSETGNIPISVNNLRANETYTFQVYGTLNLQDGNETLDLVYIGSVFVQTKTPNTLTANYSDAGNFMDAFSINFRLSDTDGVAADFEAGTLSEMTFTLYEGNSIEGSKQIYKRVLDSNDLPYVSTLKRDYYDKSMLIDPIFFGSQNGDYTAKVYTLEVSKAYDYTDFKNEIPIKNSVYTFNTNSYIPQLPDDINDAVNVTTITNRNAESFGLEHNSSLDSNMTVGYSVTPKYVNGANNSVYLVWHVWKLNAITRQYEMISDLDKRVDFNSDGTIDAVIYEVGNGTQLEVDDLDMMRRGNSYRFSFEVFLDLNEDGEVDTEYPKKYGEDIILFSKILNATKQQSSVKMYPSISNGSTYTWKYKIVDIDSALESNNLYSFVDGVGVATSSPEIVVGSDEYQTVVFSGLVNEKNFTVRKSQKLLKTAVSIYDTLVQQRFVAATEINDIKYSVTSDVNKLVITIDNYYENESLMKAVAAVDVELVPKKTSDLEKIGKLKLDGLQLNGSKIEINLFSIPQYLAIDLLVNVTAYFDSGVMGFDMDADYYALQKADTATVLSYYNYSGGSWSNSPLINGNMFKKEFNAVDETLSLELIDSEEKINLPISINQTGVLFSGNNIVLKQLKKKKLTANVGEVRFDIIIPGISLSAGSNKYNITTLLDSVDVRAQITTLDNIKIENNEIFIELYQTDASGNNAEFIKTVTKKVSDFEKSITISDLQPETHYYLQFYANVYDNATGKYEKKYLYDVDQKIHAVRYRFFTLSSVGVNSVIGKMEATSYNNKYIHITYKIEQLVGYDHIEYTLYKVVDGEYIDMGIKIPNATEFENSMEIKVSAIPGNNSDIFYGGTYAIKIRPVGYYERDGETIEMELGTVTREFTLAYPDEPHIGITASKDADTIYFRVSVYDPDFIIRNGTYDVKLVDKELNVIETFKNQSILTVNKLFEFKGDKYNLIDNEEYTFVVSVNVDRTNLATNFGTITEKKSINFGDFVNLGTVTTAKNADNDSDIDIIFSNPYKLNTINEVRYTITSANGLYISNQSEFITRYDPDKELYYFTIVTGGVQLTDNTLYTITINFYSDGVLATQTELSYYYLAKGDEADEKA